jgi:hypothetical protein
VDPRSDEDLLAAEPEAFAVLYRRRVAPAFMLVDATRPARAPA